MRGVDALIDDTVEGVDPDSPIPLCRVLGASRRAGSAEGRLAAAPRDGPRGVQTESRARAFVTEWRNLGRLRRGRGIGVRVERSPRSPLGRFRNGADARRRTAGDARRRPEARMRARANPDLALGRNGRFLRRGGLPRRTCAAGSVLPRAGSSRAPSLRVRRRGSPRRPRSWAPSPLGAGAKSLFLRWGLTESAPRIVVAPPATETSTIRAKRGPGRSATVGRARSRGPLEDLVAQATLESRAGAHRRDSSRGASAPRTASRADAPRRPRDLLEPASASRPRGVHRLRGIGRPRSASSRPAMRPSYRGRPGTRCVEGGPAGAWSRGAMASICDRSRDRIPAASPRIRDRALPSATTPRCGPPSTRDRTCSRILVMWTTAVVIDAMI